MSIKDIQYVQNFFDGECRNIFPKAARYVDHNDRTYDMWGLLGTGIVYKVDESKDNWAIGIPLYVDNAVKYMICQHGYTHEVFTYFDEERNALLYRVKQVPSDVVFDEAFHADIMVEQNVDKNADIKALFIDRACETIRKLNGNAHHRDERYDSFSLEQLILRNAYANHNGMDKLALVTAISKDRADACSTLLNNLIMQLSFDLFKAR